MDMGEVILTVVHELGLHVCGDSPVGIRLGAFNLQVLLEMQQMIFKQDVVNVVSGGGGFGHMNQQFLSLQNDLFTLLASGTAPIQLIVLTAPLAVLALKVTL